MYVHTKIVRVIPATDPVDEFRVIAVEAFAGTAHLIPEVPDTSDAPNTGWIVNNHITLKTWNEVYWMEEKELEDALKPWNERRRIKDPKSRQQQRTGRRDVRGVA